MTSDKISSQDIVLNALCKDKSVQMIRHFSIWLNMDDNMTPNNMTINLKKVYHNEI